MNIGIGIMLSLAVAVGLLFWRYESARDDLALEQATNASLTQANAASQMSIEQLQREISDRDEAARKRAAREQAEAARIEGLRENLKDALRKDPEARQWRDTRTPGIYVDFLWPPAGGGGEDQGSQGADAGGVSGAHAGTPKAQRADHQR